MGTVILLMGLILFVAGVISTNRFGELRPDYFGTLSRSAYSLFQVMTLESWSSQMAGPLSKRFWWAKLFFVCFILMTNFAVLNLLVALIINSMHEANDEADSEVAKVEKQILQKLTDTEKEVEGLKKIIQTRL